MSIKEKVSELLKLRSLIDEKKKEIEPLQQQRDELQQNIIDHLKKQGFDSIRTKTATVAKMVSKRLVIKNENLLIADLKKRGLTDYVKERINTDIWQPFARQAVKENIALEGTEISETEYISIRKKEGGEDNG